MPVFRDTQYRGAPQSELGGAERLLLDATLAATDLVLVTPLYWYSVSSSMKLYLDCFAGALLGRGSWPGDVISDEAAVARAQHFFNLTSRPARIR